MDLFHVCSKSQKSIQRKFQIGLNIANLFLNVKKYSSEECLHSSFAADLSSLALSCIDLDVEIVYNIIQRTCEISNAIES